MESIVDIIALSYSDLVERGRWQGLAGSAGKKAGSYQCTIGCGSLFLGFVVLQDSIVIHIDVLVGIWVRFVEFPFPGPEVKVPEMDSWWGKWFPPVIFILQSHYEAAGQFHKSRIFLEDIFFLVKCAFGWLVGFWSKNSWKIRSHGGTSLGIGEIHGFLEQTMSVRWIWGPILVFG